MSPLTAIPATPPAHGIMPRPEIAFPDALRLPGVESPARPNEIAPGQEIDSIGKFLGRFVEEVK